MLFKKNKRKKDVEANGVSRPSVPKARGVRGDDEGDGKARYVAGCSPAGQRSYRGVRKRPWGGGQRR